MTDNRLLDLVDARDFRTLFIDELGWENPNQADTSFDIDGQTYTFSQVAGYKGMRIWHCPQLPPRKAQRALDVLVGQSNQERLLIFSSTNRQDWRWPRRGQLGGTNAKLLAHEHIVGDRNTHLTQRLRAIELDFDEDLSLVALLEKMRDAFDHETETASVAAARMMGTLYTELENVGVGEHEATLLLARLLFLMFGDDTDMWHPLPENVFHRWIEEHTRPESLNSDLAELFDVLNTDPDRRHLPSGSPYEWFRYINGGLFSDQLRLPQLPAKFRAALIEACEFNWSVISPAVFGSMFQTVKDREARRAGGEHYTTEANILKTIGPLFLEEYTDRLARAWDDKAQLTKLHNDLGKLRFLDPACGCGNFLIVAYRELRALELEILKRRRDLDFIDGKASGGDRWQMSLDVSGDIKVRLDNFYGIEIEEWPARIAETAMLLVDHLANQKMTEEFGIAPDRLPITIAPSIYCGNALSIDWNDHLSSRIHSVLVFGNPPYNGARTLSRQKRREMEAIWGDQLNPNFDYVTAWFRKATDYLQGTDGRWAFVATSSICQGEPVADLWKHILDAGWTCSFAHRSFEWNSEAAGTAGVHASIVGFKRANTRPPQLWIYPESGRGEAEYLTVRNINPFLSNHDNYLVKRGDRLGFGLPDFTYGNMANDGNWLTVTPEQYDEVASDPIASRYLRKYVGSRELINNKDRWCLWLVSATEPEIATSPVLAARVAKVRETRLRSPRPTTQKLADTPHLFGEIRHSDEPSLGIPEVSAHGRLYLPVRRFSDAEVLSNKVYRVQDDDGYVMGVLASSMFITWMRTVGGRLRADLSFSSFTYNTFPMPPVSSDVRCRIVAAVTKITSTREQFKSRSLDWLYSPSSIPDELRAAHIELDNVIDSAFEFDGPDDWARRECLFKAWAKESNASRRLNYWA